jgi:hypothetical protein
MNLFVTIFFWDGVWIFFGTGIYVDRVFFSIHLLTYLKYRLCVMSIDPAAILNAPVSNSIPKRLQASILLTLTYQDFSPPPSVSSSSAPQ